MTRYSRQEYNCGKPKYNIRTEYNVLYWTDTKGDMAQSLHCCMIFSLFLSWDGEWCKWKKDLNAICRLKINIVRTLCESIRFWLRKGVKGKELDLLVVMALANLINYLISHKKLTYIIYFLVSPRHKIKKTIVLFTLWLMLSILLTCLLVQLCRPLRYSRVFSFLSAKRINSDIP